MRSDDQSSLCLKWLYPCYTCGNSTHEFISLKDEVDFTSVPSLYRAVITVT